MVSGINGGLNAGINVLYSGTVAAAIEGAFFGVTSVAVSLEFDEHARFGEAARLARQVIRQILDKKGPEPQLYNLNIPTAALRGAAEVCVVPMNVTRYGDSFQKRTDPWGRDYFWLTGGPPARRGRRNRPLRPGQGKVTITPLDYDLTRRAALAEMGRWQFQLPRAADQPAADRSKTFASDVRIVHKKRKEGAR